MRVYGNNVDSASVEKAEATVRKWAEEQLMLLEKKSV